MKLARIVVVLVCSIWLTHASPAASVPALAESQSVLTFWQRFSCPDLPCGLFLAHPGRQFVVYHQFVVNSDKLTQFKIQRCDVPDCY